MWSEQSQRTKGWLSSDAIGRMFEIDDQGLVQLKVGGSLYVAPDGKIRIRTGATLGEGPGSPIELNAKVTPAKIAQIEATIEDNDTSTRDTLAATSAAVLALQTDKQNVSAKNAASGYAGLTANTVLNYVHIPIRSYTVTLSGGTGQLVTTDFVDLRTFAGAAIWVQRSSFGSSPGHLTYSRAGSGTIDVASSDGGDDGDVEIIIMGDLA